MIKRRVAGGLIAASLALTACSAPRVSGDGSLAPNAELSGPVLEQAAKHAMLSATSFRVSGAEGGGTGAVELDVHFGRSSTQGSVTVDGHRVGVLYAGGRLYIRASREFWLSFAPSGSDARRLLARLGDKWVHLRAGAAGFSDLAAFVIRKKFLAKAAARPDKDRYVKGPAATLSGVRAVSFVDKSDSDSTAYVPATGTPYPIRIETDDGEDAGSLELTDWNRPFTASPPPAKDVVELPH